MYPVLCLKHIILTTVFELHQITKNVYSKNKTKNRPVFQGLLFTKFVIKF